ncbi:MAG: formylglycine-generating enzyme family protein, partial [Verrucomicrobiota bacterium]
MGNPGAGLRRFCPGKPGRVDTWRDPQWEGHRVTPGPTHPVVAVNWQDARDYARWLTEREQKAGKLAPGQSYRLPTDLEWSTAVGLAGETGTTPAERDMKVAGVYPWGREWPPVRGAGNFADATYQRVFPKQPVLDGYDDDFAVTSPVGSFAPLANGLQDLSGNVWEWCEDTFDGDPEKRVLRGGSWLSHAPGNLLSSRRGRHPPGSRDLSVGFRLVLV